MEANHLPQEVSPESNVQNEPGNLLKSFLAASAVVVGTMAVSPDAEAKNPPETSADNTTIASIETTYTRDGLPGMSVEVTRTLGGDTISIVDKSGNPVVLSRGLSFEKADMTPARLKFEIANKGSKQLGVYHNVNGTNISMSAYAKNTLAYLGITYTNGVLTFPKNTIPLANANIANIPGVKVNTDVELLAQPLAPFVRACVKDQLGVSLYLISNKDGGGSVEQEKDLHRVATQCNFK